MVGTTGFVGRPLVANLREVKRFSITQAIDDNQYNTGD